MKLKKSGGGAAGAAMGEVAESARRGSWREGKESAAKRGYGSRWQKARIGFLLSHPLCAMCEKLGRATAASVVDHITPHRGDMALFWDHSNWQALCKDCHDRHKSREERGGTVLGCDVNGMPLDEKHWWNKNSD